MTSLMEMTWWDLISGPSVGGPGGPASIEGAQWRLLVTQLLQFDLIEHHEQLHRAYVRLRFGLITCDVMKKHEFEVLGCTEASGVAMTCGKSQTRILLC